MKVTLGPLPSIPKKREKEKRKRKRDDDCDRQNGIAERRESGESTAWAGKKRKIAKRLNMEAGIY